MQNDRPERERVIEAILAVMGPVFGSPEYLADPVKLARAEKRRRDGAEAYADAVLAALRPADGLVEDITTLDVFLAAYAKCPDGDVIASVIDPTDDLLTLGALRRILTALRSQEARNAE